MTRTTRELGRRCTCRPGCLTWLRTSDDLVITVNGAAIATHLPSWQPPARDVPLTFDFGGAAL